VDLRNYFEAIFNFIVYRDGDKPTLVRLPAGGGRAKSSGVQCFTEAGSVNFNFMSMEKTMNQKALFSITLTIMALLTLLIVNPALAAGEKEGVTKSNEIVASMEKININQADAKTLTTLKGIGKDRAVKIIEYREKNGPFEKVEDIMKVKGIGKKIFEKNKNLISV
jgi:competence protein ComEA